MGKGRFSYPGDVLEEDMSAGEQGRYGKTHDLLFTVENLLDLRDQALEQIECRGSFSDSSDIGQSRSPCNRSAGQSRAGETKTRVG